MPYDVIDDVFVATSGLNISESKPDRGMFLKGILKQSAKGLSIGHVPDDVT